MSARSSLSDANRKIALLIDLACSPYRRDYSRLVGDAELIKRARKDAAQRVEDARSFEAKVRWIPIVNRRASSRLEAAIQVQTAEEYKWRHLCRKANDIRSVIKKVNSARHALSNMNTFLESMPVISDAYREDCETLLRQVRFLEKSWGKSAPETGRLPKAFAMLRASITIAKAIGSEPAGRSRPLPSPGPQQPQHNVPIKKSKGRTQLSLDFDGTGQVEEEGRIWLPVSASRTYELKEKGALLDREAPRRGSQLYIPLSRRKEFDAYLPLAFRETHTSFAFPPIRDSAVGQNMHKVFDRDSWNHIRTTAYDRAGHRCQVCGKQRGSLWECVSTQEERRRGGLVDAHEVWEWDVIDENAGIGIQRLKQIIVVCKDCHMMFHEGRAVAVASKHGLGDKAREYIKVLRMLVNRCDSLTLEAQVELDHQEWQENSDKVSRWILDLSHLSTQDYMNSHKLVLRSDNEAGMTPAHIGGISFATEDGETYSATPAQLLARGVTPEVSLQGPINR